MIFFLNSLIRFMARIVWNSGPKRTIDQSSLILQFIMQLTNTHSIEPAKIKAGQFPA